MSNTTPNTCPKCPHGKGFNCPACWPKQDAAAFYEAAVKIEAMERGASNDS